MEYVKLHFHRVPKRSGYFSGRTYMVPKNKAQQFISGGYAVSPSLPLPDNFPHRERLISAGLDTIDAVRAESDLTAINRIGKKAADEIETFLKSL